MWKMSRNTYPKRYELYCTIREIVDPWSLQINLSIFLSIQSQSVEKTEPLCALSLYRFEILTRNLNTFFKQQ